MLYDDQVSLLLIAREAIRERLVGEASLTYKRIKQNPSEYLSQVSGCFVTLKQDIMPATGNDLRGCIGSILGRAPLFEEVRRLACESAFHDPRFRPLSLSEYPHIVIEISVLTPPVKVSSYKVIRVGIDGIFLHYQGRSAVFLPQVADEQGWDRDETLDHLAMKAGFDESIWRLPECTFEIFQAEVFREDS